MATNFNVAIVEAAQALDSCSASLADSPLPSGNFRLQFPGFASSVAYPDAQINFYIGMAYKLLSADRWGTMLDEGVALFAAHFLALDKLSLTAGINGVPGSAVGILNGGTVSKTTWSREIASVMEDKAGHWGMTIYGLQYLRFARMMGAGPVQIGASSDSFPQSAALYSGAWPGPFGGA